ncbi:hypothetical protein A3770_02p15400 [Chloropicon primus]|uniref:Cilia- and flagella-associated protein 43 n=1 Tax=Chloropicon primus TaxID=1764295 RepID=A0A5B8MI21_9CHLO|nr:hypothetical protein A3770_02p15400 [Chloropicon primus]|eukprot:QDZ19022.1 hypothetical protein A3770_02p15400 [Chloropicon primus]
MEVTTVIGLTDEKVGFASRSTLITACGRHLCLRDIFSSRKEYITVPGQGVKTITFNPRDNAFAVAEINEDPRVFIYDSLSRKLSCTLEDAGTMEVAALGFSAYGNRFVTVSGAPDYRVKVWDLSTGTVLVQGTVGFQATEVIFNPHNKDEFVVYGNGKLVFWQVKEMYQKFLLDSKTPDLDDLYPNCCEWNPRGGLLIGCKTGEVILQDSAADKPMSDSEGKPVVVAKVDEEVKAIRVHGRTVILGVQNRPCKGFPLSQVTLNPGSTSVGDVFPEIMSTNFIGFDPYYDKVVLSTAQGCLFIFDVAKGLAQAKQVAAIGAFHRGRITNLKFLDEGSHFVASSWDSDKVGSLCAWSLKDGDLLWKKSFSSPQVAMDCCKEKKIVASAGKDGIVTAMSFKDMEAPRVIFRKKVHTGPGKAVSFSLKGGYLASMDNGGHVFFMAVDEEGQSLRVIGYVPVTSKNIGLTWTKHLDAGDEGLCLVSLSSNELMGIDPPPTTYAADSLMLDEICKTRRLRLDSNATAMHGFHSSDGEGGTLVAIGNDKKVKQYRLPSEDQAWGGFKGRITQPENVYLSLMKQGDAIATSGDMTKVISASKEGKVVIASESDEPVTLRPHNSILGGASAVACDNDGGCIISGGVLGEILVYMDASKEVKDPPRVKFQLKHMVDEGEPLSVDVIRENDRNVREKAHQGAEPDKVKVRGELKSLQEQIQVLIQKNAQAPALEQLESTEFILDKEYVNEWDNLSKDKAQRLKQDLEFKRTKDLIIAKRLKDLAWNSMRQKGSVIRSLNTNVEVNNFPIGQPGKDSSFLKKLIYLRSVGKAEHVYLKEDQDDATLGGEEASDPQPAQSKSPTGKGSPAADEKPDESVVKSLLYPDAKMSHPRRKRLQILMIEELIMEYKDQFNKSHKKHKEHKEGLVDRIGDLSKRAKELSDEIILLGGTAPEEEMFEIQMSKPEIASNFLEVQEGDITVEKYLSPAERQRIAEEEAAEAARRAAQKGDNVGERGLKDMMGGTLHKAKASEVSELERPEWMDMPPEEMSDEQRKELKEFEHETKVLAEEREKRRKALEAEYKKIRSDALEACAKFDESVIELHKAKLDMTSLINRMEMDIIRLCIALEQAERIDAIKETSMLSELEELRSKKSEVGELLSNFKHEVDTELEQLETYVQEDKTLEKAFKKDFAECEEFFDRLLKLFRKRTHKGRVNSEKSGQQLIQTVRRQGNVAGKMNRRMSMLAVGQQDLKRQARVPSYLQGSRGEVDADDSNDPWAKGIEKIGNSNDNEILSIDPLNAAEDRPEGLDPHWWNKLVDARNRKIQTETAVKKQMNLVLRMQKYLAYLTNKDNDLKMKLETVTQELNDLHTQREYRIWDVDMSLELRQGQVEIVQDLVSANMDDALLLERTVIQDRNQVIEKHGGQKVDILKAIKDFKKGIYDIQWENQRLEMLEEDWAEKTKEFQLLRVTKGLQSFLKSGEDTSNSSEQAALESRLDHNKALSNKTIKEKQKSLNKIQRIITDVRHHNMQLQQQVTELEYEVQEEQHANKSKKEEHDDGGKKTAARRMRSLVTERKLADISKAQAEEISLLKQELERLRRRTFPSFTTMRA